MKFSLLQLCGWTAVIGGLCGVVFGLPSVISVALFGLAALAMPVVMISGIVYARDALRAFFVGAMVAGSPLILMSLYYVPLMVIEQGVVEELMSMTSANLAELDKDGSMTLVKYNCAGYFTFIALNGLLAVVVRWLVSPRVVASPQRSGAAAADASSSLERIRASEANGPSSAPPAPHFERSAELAGAGSTALAGSDELAR